MSNMIDEIKKQEEEAERRSAAAALVKRDKEKAKQETAASEENEENDVDLEAAIAKAFADENDAPKPKKTLKGVYIDDDVLKVYEAVAEHKGRGWGSQKISDLLRNEFIKEGLMKR